MLGFKVENPNLSFVVQGMNDDNLAYFNTLLGEGEVSAIINQKEQTINIQESIFTGFWRITIVDNENNLISDCIEVGDIPEAIVALNQKKSNKILFDSALLPESVINAPAILTELKDKRQEYEASKKTLDAINLTLLPHTEDDLTAINKILGFGDTVILSRGYGNCRITSTGISAIWWVKYFNSTDNEILSTIEITDIPIVACAAQEDIQDSTERLKEFTDEL
jgi:hydrogenase-1 operon protein HyaF